MSKEIIKKEIKKLGKLKTHDAEHEMNNNECWCYKEALKDVLKVINKFL